MYFELRQDGVPDEVETAEEVASEERVVEEGEVLRQEDGEGTDGLLRGEVLWAPGQMEHMLLYTRLQLQQTHLLDFLYFTNSDLICCFRENSVNKHISIL